jgi:hypothetical protein
MEALSCFYHEFGRIWKNLEASHRDLGDFHALSVGAAELEKIARDETVLVAQSRMPVVGHAARREEIAMKARLS